MTNTKPSTEHSPGIQASAHMVVKQQEFCKKSENVQIKSATRRSDDILSVKFYYTQKRKTEFQDAQKFTFEVVPLHSCVNECTICQHPLKQM